MVSSVPPPLCPAWIKLPALTRFRLIRPETGAVTVVYSKFSSASATAARAEASAAFADTTAAFADAMPAMALRTSASALCNSDLRSSNSSWVMAPFGSNFAARSSRQRVFSRSASARAFAASALSIWVKACWYSAWACSS